MSNTVVVKSVDRASVESAVETFARSILRKRLEVVSVIWFGSWMSGTPTPESDVDICLILSRSGKRFRDRIPDYLPGGFPVGIDLFPYTEKEFQKLAITHPGWHGAILSGRSFRGNDG